MQVVSRLTEFQTGEPFRQVENVGRKFAASILHSHSERGHYSKPHVAQPLSQYRRDLAVISGSANDMSALFIGV